MIIKIFKDYLAYRKKARKRRLEIKLAGLMSKFKNYDVLFNSNEDIDYVIITESMENAREIAETEEELRWVND